MTPAPQDAATIGEQYQRAQTLIQGYWTRNIVANSTVFPIWIDGSDCFWYERDTEISQQPVSPAGSLAKWNKEYRLVNARTASNTRAFDSESLAVALAEAAQQTVDKNCLPITDVSMTLATTVETVHFTAFDRSWVFDTRRETVIESTALGHSKDPLVSPDGQSLIFIRDHNLWLKDLNTGEERALTEDGEPFYCYGALGDAWGGDMDIGVSTGVQARWSADSKRVLTVQRDTRQVHTLPVVEHVPKDGSLRPKLRELKLSLKGDEQVPDYRLLSIDVTSGRVQAAHYPHIPITRNSLGFFASNLGWWNPDSQTAYCVDVSRDYKSVKVVEFNTSDGRTRVLFEETSATHINLMINADEFPTFVPLPETDELIWYSERSGWAHLYLYDLKTGALKNPITSGEWVVRNIVSMDLDRRELILHTMGRTPGRDPYYRDLVSVHLDTGELSVLASSDHDYFAVSDHQFDLDTLYAEMVGRDINAASSLSHQGDFAVVMRSRADGIPVCLLLDRQGEQILEIEQGNLSALHSAVSEHWQWPEPVKLCAADGKTDLYGLVYKPSNFSPEQSYPVLSYVFNVPDLPRVSKGSFSNGTAFGRYYLEAAALAELGFIVVMIDGRGTPYRQKAFQDESYGWIESAGNLADHVAGIRQLAQARPYMDLSRVGIHSLGGGTGAVQALLQYPDFYQVGVGGIFHDSRLMSAPMWSDMFEGAGEPAHQYPECYAEKLQGKLLMVHGMLDVWNPPACTFRMVEALQKANKDFDLLLMPNMGHSATDSYVTRRAWDYLVRHLQGVEPPKDFKLATARELS